MKANEFVKKHGWDAVINAVKSTNAEETSEFESTDLYPILSKRGDTIGFNVKVYRIKYGEVKRLAESYELVESYGGLFEAKIYADSEYRSLSAPQITKRLKQAIADVEGCL